MDRREVDKFMKLVKSATPPERTQIRDQISAIIAETEAENKEAAKTQIEQLVAQFGFSGVEDVYGKFRASGGRAAKYANPANPKETWTGQGRQPRWIKAAKAKGLTLDQLLVPEKPVQIPASA